MQNSDEASKPDELLDFALQWIKENAAPEADAPRANLSFVRGAAELEMLAQAFPGLQFTDMCYTEHLAYSEDLDLTSGDHVYIRVIGSGADLVHHDFLSARQLEAVAKCKRRKVFRDDDGSCIEVDRCAAGFRIRRRVPLDIIAPILAPRVWSPKVRSIR